MEIAFVFSASPVDIPVNELGEPVEGMPWVFMDEPTIEYSILRDSPDFKFDRIQSYRIHVTELEIAKYDHYHFKDSDGKDWWLPYGEIYGISGDELAELSEGDKVDFIAFVTAGLNDSELGVYQMKFEKVVKKRRPQIKHKVLLTALCGVSLPA